MKPWTSLPVAHFGFDERRKLKFIKISNVLLGALIKYFSDPHKADLLRFLHVFLIHASWLLS